MRHHKVNELLGVNLAPAQIEGYLTQLELKVVRKPRPLEAEATPLEPVTVKIPTFRVDLKREVDLVEEVVRLFGVDKIPSTAPRGAIGTHAYDAVHDQLAETRRILAGLGLNESQGQTLISDAAAGLCTDAEEIVSLANPLSSEMNVLRPSLLPGLLDALRHNLSHKNYDIALFELGRVFRAGVPQASTGAAGAASPGAVVERRHVGIALTGQRNAPFWSGPDRDTRFDIFDLKAAVEGFFSEFGLRGFTFQRRAESTRLFLESATIHLGKFQLGEIGQLLPALSKEYDLRDAVFLGELNLDLLLARRNTAKAFKPLPAFPPVRRDIAMLLPEATAHEAVLQAARQAKPANLESIELFDIFRGKNVPAGQKSMAYAFTYRSAERTLTDAEVNAAHEKVIAQLKQKLQAAIRE